MSTASQLVSNIDPGVDNNTYSTALEQNIENHSKAFMFNFSQKKSYIWYIHALGHIKTSYRSLPLLYALR